MRYKLASITACTRERRSGGSPKLRVLSWAAALVLGACGQGNVDPHDLGGAGSSGSSAGAGSADDPILDPRNPNDPGEAETLWSRYCSSCHGDFPAGSALSSGNMNGDFRLDAIAAVERHGDGLEAYIDAAMPVGNPDLCTGACADALGAYLRSLQSSGQVACNEVSPAVGARQVMLLSSREYQNALEDLLGVPTELGRRVASHDGRRGGFVNMIDQSVSSTLLDTYRRNADTVAEWAVSNGRPFVCADTTACAQRFVDEFLFQAFRGPVSDEQKNAYQRLFTQYPDQGLQLALKAALSSPLFLYRVEVGVDLETARAAGYYDPEDQSTSTPGDAAPSTGQPSETKVAQEFEPDSNGRLVGDIWMLDQNGRIRVAFSESFTDPAIVEVMARGSNHGDIWPELRLRVDGTEVGMQRVDTEDVRPYRFDVAGITGTVIVEIAFENDSGEPPYGPGQDANLFVQAVRLFRAGDPTAPEPSPTPEPTSPGAGGLLDGAAPNAFVLTPFELASTLAFRLTGSAPDRTLLEAARAGRLSTRADVRAQVARLIDSERGRAHIGEFVTRWFRLDGLEQVLRPGVPELTDDVKAAMLEEVRHHFLHVFYDESVPYSEFFGGNYTFLNRTLAEFYGIPGQFDESFRQTMVEGRGGPLASGAFMTVNAHADRTAPILRAVRSREAALCHHIDSPNSPLAGDDIDAQRAAAQERVTEREQAAGVLSSRDFFFLYTDEIDACAGCHERIINPMFGMEDFDNVGRLRPSAGANTVIERVHGMETPVSIEGTLYGVASTSDPAVIEYAGAKDLSNQLASTQAVSDCLARKAFRFVTGTTYVERDTDASHNEILTPEQRDANSCVAANMLQAFESNQHSPRAMFIELATDSLLYFRR